MTTPSLSELASAIGENVLLNRELNEVRARMNALAVSNAKLEQERDALRQEAERLKGESKANQEAADVLRLIEENQMTMERMAGIGWRVSVNVRGNNDVVSWVQIDLKHAVLNCAKAAGITLPAKDEQPVTSPSPDVASGAEGEGKYFVEASDSGTSVYVVCRESNVAVAECEFLSDRQFEGMGQRIADALNGTSPVHQQLAEIERLRAFREEIESLRRCRDAWDAVRKWQMDIIGDWAGDSWKAKSFRFAISRHATDFKADPIEAVLELAKALEKGG